MKALIPLDVGGWGWGWTEDSHVGWLEAAEGKLDLPVHLVCCFLTLLCRVLGLSLKATLWRPGVGTKWRAGDGPNSSNLASQLLCIPHAGLQSVISSEQKDPQTFDNGSKKLSYGLLGPGAEQDCLRCLFLSEQKLSRRGMGVDQCVPKTSYAWYFS